MEKENKHLYFIGIGGCGVSALAEIALAQGYQVAGSDFKESEYTEKLIAQNILVSFEPKAENITQEINLVIRSSAVPDEQVEVKKARELKIPVIKHSEFLGILMKGKYGICVAGSHGKTTTDALIGLILKQANLKPTIEVGGVVPELGGNFLVGESRYFVAEACEFDHSFLHLKPNIAIILNIETDHPDSYPDLKSLKRAFIDFLNLVPRNGYIIANDESPEVLEVLRKTTSRAKIITFGFHEKAEIRIEKERVLENQAWQFLLTGLDKRQKPLLTQTKENLPVFDCALNGRHNLLNATAALIVADLLGVDLQITRQVLGSFKGVQRRFELVDQRFGITIITDYAHHPSQIKATLKAAKRKEFKRLIVVFQPHTYSRTKALFDEFTKSFLEADQVILTKTYVPVGRHEKMLSRYTAKALAKEIQKNQENVFYINSLEKVKNKLKNILAMGDAVLLLGAGDIYQIGKEILGKN